MSELPPIQTWDPATVRAVALAYRQRRQQGDMDLPAREAAQDVFDAMHPDLDTIEASRTVAQIIAAVARDHTAWFWKGVGEGRT